MGSHPKIAGPSLRLAEWAVNVSRSRTETALAQAAEGFKDLLACLIAGSREAAPSKLAGLSAKIDSGPCSLIGHDNKVSAPWAALVNGTAAHVLDFDDSLEPLQGHVSCTIIPALLALAEDRDLSGLDMLDAYVIGVEAASVIGAANPEVYNRGWHATAAIGTISTAVACARLLRASVEEMLNAISISVSSASGTMLQKGYDMKFVQPGLAARDGLLAALLAKEGVTGNPEPLSGPGGLSDLWGDKRVNAAEAYVIPTESTPLAIVSPGIIYKPYPTCGSTHRAIDAVLELVAAHHLSPDQIASIEVECPFSCVRNLAFDRPENPVQARFSLHYCLALAVTYQRLRLSDFEHDKIKRPELVAFLPKVKLDAIEGSEHTTKTYLDFPVSTRIRLQSGEELRDSRYERKGDVRKPFKESDWDSKLNDCLLSVLPEEKARVARQAIEDVSGFDKVRDLMSTIR